MKSKGKAMKFKTKLLADRFVSVVSEWPGVECISLNEAALPDTLDPYFALILDIYCGGPIPAAEERCKLFGDDIAAFETSSVNSVNEGKDRFLVGDLPVRLEFKSTKLIEELAAIADSRLEFLWLVKDSGTYGFYRLMNGELLFSRNDWILGLRKRLGSLGDEFWRRMRNAHESKMEHFLSDLGAAVFQEDDFYYLISAAGFVKSACLTLFCINRCFEPSHRAYYGQVFELPELPESFKAQLENFLKPEDEMNMDRKLALAKIMARGIVAL
jgi:hypothetical protein